MFNYENLKRNHSGLDRKLKYCQDFSKYGTSEKETAWDVRFGM